MFDFIKFSKYITYLFIFNSYFGCYISCTQNLTEPENNAQGLKIFGITAGAALVSSIVYENLIYNICKNSSEIEKQKYRHLLSNALILGTTFTAISRVGKEPKLNFNNLKKIIILTTVSSTLYPLMFAAYRSSKSKFGNARKKLYSYCANIKKKSNLACGIIAVSLISARRIQLLFKPKEN